MASTSLPPNSPPSAVPPASTTIAPPPPPFTASSPPQSFSPLLSTSPPSQPTARPPEFPIPSTPSPQPPSPSPALSTAPSAEPSTAHPQPPMASPPPTTSLPPGSSNADPPSTSNSPPPPSSQSASPRPPPSNSDPPTTSISPPLPPPSQSTSPPTSLPPPEPSSNQPTSPPPSQSASPPITSPPPSQSASPPITSPPPAPPSNPPTSPPPPLSNPPRNSPPSSSTPPPIENSPPPASPNPPQNSPPPSSSKPPEISPPPPPVSLSQPPSISPPPGVSTPPENSPPPPALVAPPPRNTPPPPRPSPPPPASQPTPSPSNSTTNASTPPPPVIKLGPPPLSLISPPSTVNNSIPSAPESSNPTGNGGIGTGGIVAICVGIGLVMLSLIGLAVWCKRKHRKKVSGLDGVYVMPPTLGSSPRSDSTFTKTQFTSAPLRISGSSSEFVYSPTEPGGLGNSRSWFTYEELVKATNGFSSNNLLGEGGFGSVYKGCLPDGREVAVKQLKIGGGQGEREFKSEVEIISRIHHRHLVSLVGYCISENQRLLIYDYVPNSTLHFHLHGEGRPVLDWAARVKIAVGAARGIAYLHEDCHPRIIHRDIKSSNILLDNHFEAKVSDFGLAKLALDANTHVTTRVMGTFGYMAPEYASSGKLTEKSDVFSYGVLLLELITGRKPVDASQPMGEESLVEWARPLLSHALEDGEFEGLVDPRLGKNYVESEMFRMIEAAAVCVRHSAAKRPRMGQVVRAFDNLATADLTNGMRVGESQVYNLAEQSAEIRWFRRIAFGSQNYSTDFFSEDSLDSERGNVNTGRNEFTHEH